MRIAAFTRYGRRAASTRQRFLQYFPALRAAGIEVDHHALLDDEYVESLVSGRRFWGTKVARAYGRRIEEVLSARGADLFWIYVELLPYLPAGVERSLTGSARTVYDFDDAFFHAYDRSGNPLVRAALGNKHAKLLSSATACVCGNAYLRDYAARHCPESIILPTVVDTDKYVASRKRAAKPVTIGWIGSPSTWSGVRPILPVLRDICDRHGARFLVVGPGLVARPDVFPGMELRDWSEATEIADVQAMDIGIMPLLDLPFERGKSGYKLIQYMACEVPVAASAIGVNCEIVDHGTNGFLASSASEWEDALKRLIGDPALRRRLGKAGRQAVVEHYSLASQAPRLVELLKSAAKRPVEDAAPHG